MFRFLFSLNANLDTYLSRFFKRVYICVFDENPILNTLEKSRRTEIIKGFHLCFVSIRKGSTYIVGAEGKGGTGGNIAAGPLLLVGRRGGGRGHAQMEGRGIGQAGRTERSPEGTGHLVGAALLLLDLEPLALHHRHLLLLVVVVGGGGLLAAGALALLGAVLVVGVLFLVQDTEPFRLLDKGRPLLLAQQLPLLPQVLQVETNINI